MFNIPNLLTIFNMVCGICSIILSLNGRVDLAPYPLFLALVFDYLDGFVARLLKQQGELGKQLDSLADVVSFGLAPGMMMLVIMTYGIYYPENPHIWGLIPDHMQMKAIYTHWCEGLISGSDINLLPLVSLFIPVFSMLRLAKFNIDTRQSDQFIGLPTPANTLFFCSFPILMSAGFDPHGIQQSIIDQLTQPWSLVVIILVMSFMLIMELPLLALKFKNFNWADNQMRFVFLITCLLLIVFARYWSLPIIVILYIFISIIDNITKKQSK